MAWQNTCPACGEADRLEGRSGAGADEIEIHCLSCDHRWTRGERHCATCGGSDILDIPRMMTRQPRGNQVAVVGRRDLPVCRNCDSDVLKTYLTSNRPVSEDYVSAALVDRDAPPSVRSAPPRAGRADRPKPSRTMSNSQPPKAATRPGASSALTDPTVRQAVEDFLSSDKDADPTVLVLLGARLGPTRRVAELENDGLANQLASWITTTWGEAGRRRDAAIETIARLTQHWFERGWTTVDVGAELR